MLEAVVEDVELVFLVVKKLFRGVDEASEVLHNSASSLLTQRFFKKLNNR